MSNLGTLSFDVDLDLSKLKSKINQQNEAVKQALEGLQVKVATKSVGELAQQIQSELNNHQFAIKLDEAKLSGLKSDIVSIAEKSKEIADNFARMGHGGGGTQQAVNIDLSKFNGISEIIEKIEGEMKRLYNVFADTTDGSGKQVAGLITNLSLLKDALEQLGTAAKNFTPTQQLNEAATAAQNVATATQNAAKATKTASDEEAEATKKANIERERQLKLIAEVQTMLSKIGGISSENTGLNPQRINEVKQAYEGMLNSLSTIPPSKSLQELSAELATLKANTKGFFQEVSQSQKAVESIRLVRYALKQVNEQMASGNTSPKLEGFREQLQAINREMHNLMKAGNLDGIQNLFAGHKGMSDGVVSIIRQMVTEMKKLGVATQETAGITSHLSAEEQKLAQSIQQSTNSMRGQSQILSDLKTMAMQYLSVWGAQSFIHNIIQTGGLLEQQRMSIGAILGDLSQANHLFGQIQQLALKSPFGVVQLDTMSKQLTAYNFKYSELYDWTKRLADISAATGTEVSRLSLALGHVRSEGALSGYTLRQFAMGNVPLLQTLAQQLGKTTSEIRKMTREKAITYDDVEKALRTLTDEGGIFFNAQEVMSNALNAKFKNMYDAFDIMFGKMAESGVGDVLKKVAETMTVLAKNWEQTGAVILSVAGYLGIHKVAMLANSKALVANNIASGEFTAKQIEMQAASGTLTKQMLLQAVATGKVEVATVEAAGAVHGLTVAQLEHVKATGKVSAAYNLGTIAASKYSVAQLRVMAQFRQIPAVGPILARLQAGWYGVTAAAGTAARAIGAFLKAFWPMLAISAVVEVVTHLIQKSNEAKERIQDLLQTAGEGFRNLEKDALQFKVGASVNMDEKQLTESIKEMEEILKSYLPNAGHGVLNEAFKIDPETGKSVHSLKEQYEMLAEELETTKEAYRELGRISDIFEQSNNDTDGWFDESFRENTEDYIDALKKRNQAEVDFIANNRQKIVDVLKETRDAFGDYDAAVSKGITLYRATNGKEGFAESDLKAQIDLLKDNAQEMQHVTDQLHKSGGDVYHDWVMFQNAISGANVAMNDMYADMKVFNEKAVGRLEATFGATKDKWTEAQKLAVQKAIEIFMTGIDGYSSMAEKERLEIEQKLLKDYNITVNLDAREANKAVTELQAYLTELVGKDWVIKLKLQGATTMMEATEQIEKGVKAAQSTIDKFKDLKGPDGKPLKKGKDGKYIIPVGVQVEQPKEEVKTNYAPWGEGIKQAGKDAKKGAKDAKEAATNIYIAAQEYNNGVETIAEANKVSEKTGIKFDNKAADKAAKSAESAARKEETAAEKRAKERTKQAEAQLKIEEELAKQRLELEDAIADAEVAAIENNAERERRQRDEEFKKQKRQLDKQVEEWKRKSFELAKKEYEANSKNKKVSFYDTVIGKAGWQGQALTKDQIGTYEAGLKKLNAERKRYEKELYEQQVKYLHDYLKEYGGITAKKYAIEEEYNKKIAEAQDKWLKKSLEEEKKKALNAIDIEVLRTEIDWTTMFEGIGDALRDEMVSTLEKIESYMRTDAFKALDAKEKREYVNMRNELVSKTGGGVGTFDFSIYGKIAENLKAYQKAVLAHKTALREQAIAEQGVIEAKKELQKAEEELKKNVTQENLLRVEAAKKGLTFAELMAQKAKQKVENTEGEAVQTQGDLTTSTTQAQQAIDNFSNAMSEMTDGSLHGFANGLVKLIQAIGGKEGKGLSGLGKAGGIIGAILSIIDALGDDPAGTISGIIDKIFNVFTTLSEQLGSMEFVNKILKSIVSGIGNLFTSIFQNIKNAIGNFQWTDIFLGATGGSHDILAALGISGDEFEETEKERQERYSKYIDATTSSLSRMTEELDKASGVLAMTFGDELKNTIIKQMEVIVNGIDAVMWDDYGGTHSDYYHFNKDQDLFYAMMPYMNKHGVNAYEESQGHYTWQEIMRNNPGQLAAMFKEIQTADPELWNKIVNEVGYNDGKLEEWLNKLIDAYDQLGEAADKTNEKLTTTTKENVFDDFLNSLYELADGSEDVFDDIEKNWQKMVNRMVIDNLIAGEFQEKLKQWYEDLAQLQRERNGIASDFDQEAYENERQKLLDEIQRLRNDNQRDAFSVIPGYEYHREEIEALLKQLADLDKAAKEAQTGTQISDEEYQRRLEELKAQYQEWVKEGKDSIEFFTEMGLIQPIDEVAEHFGDLKDKFLDTLTDMSFDAEQFARELKQTMFKDLIEQNVLNVPITVTVNGQEQVFDNFDAYAKNWNKRYNDALKAGDEAAIQALIEELVRQQELMAQAAEDYRQLMQEATDTTFKDMSDSLVSSLMDMSKSAEDWAQEVGKMMAEKIIKEMIVPTMLQPLLNNIQDVFNGVMAQAVTKDAEGNTIYNWDAIFGSDELNNAIQELVVAYPQAAEYVKKIMDLFDLYTTNYKYSGFSNLGDSILDSLKSSESSLEKWAKEQGQKMAEQMAQAYIDKKYGDRIKELNEEWQKALEEGNAEEIESIRLELEKLYATMGDDEELQKLIDDFKKADTTFSDMTSSWVSSLMDFNATAEDWAEELGKTIAKKIIEQTVVGTMLQPLLDNLNDAVNNALSSYGTNYKAMMADGGIKAAMDEIIAAYPQMKEIVESILGAFGIKGDNPFADMVSTFTSSLMDMNATAESFAQDIARTLTEQMMQKVLTDGYKGQLDELGEQWRDALENGDVAAIERIKQQLVELRAEMGEAVQPLLDAISDIEKQADTTFSSMTDSWVSALMDMESTAEDFAQQVGKTMAQKIITELIAPIYIQPILDAMQKAYNAAIAVNGATVTSVMTAMLPYIDQIKSVYGELQPIIENIMGTFGIYKDEVQEAAEEVEYALQDLKSNFVSSLMDMTSSAEDFAQDISKIMAQSFIEKFILGDMFDARMKQWQEQYESILGSGMSEDERKRQLKQLRDAIVAAREDYTNQAAAIMELFGLTTEDSQQATTNMSDKITYDQADQLLGIELAQLLTQEQILATMNGAEKPTSLGSLPNSISETIAASQTPFGNINPLISSLQSSTAADARNNQLLAAALQGIADVTHTGNDYILTQVAMANSYLQMLRDYSKQIRDEVVMHLGSMDNKLSRLREL